MSRTSTLVSTARTPSSHPLPDALFHLGDRPPLRRPVRKDRFVQILGRVATRPSNDDVFAVFIPLEDRARADAEPSPDFQGHRDLTLSRYLRVRQRHAPILPR